MLRTGISVSTWEKEGDAVTRTAFKLLAAAAADSSPAPAANREIPRAESYDSIDDSVLHELGLP